MKEQLVNILFKEEDAKSLKLQPGTMTLSELYSESPMCWVLNAAGDGRYIKRRNFHIVSGIEIKEKEKAIVCDIDGCLNYLASKIAGTNHRNLLELADSTVVQWTEIDKTVFAKPVESMFAMLKHYARLGYKIIFLTARGESQRVVTEMFLDKHLSGAAGQPVQYSLKYTLFMRGMTVNDTPAPELKTIAMQAAILPYYEVEWFIEDCPKNVAAMREACPEVPIMHILRD